MKLIDSLLIFIPYDTLRDFDNKDFRVCGF